jgi:hypothetical protein
MIHRLEPPCCTCGEPLICPAGGDAEILAINEILHEYGFDYPQGARGVRDALGRLTGRLNNQDATC